MSYDRLPSLEAQPTTTRREDDITYRDDPEFQNLTQGLSSQLFTLTSNVSKLSNQVALLGTKRDTERVRERVHDLLEETQSGFKRIGEGVKKAQAWDEVGVSVIESPSQGDGHQPSMMSPAYHHCSSRLIHPRYDSPISDTFSKSSSASFNLRSPSSRLFNGPRSRSSGPPHAQPEMQPKNNNNNNNNNKRKALHLHGNSKSRASWSKHSYD